MNPDSCVVTTQESGFLCCCNTRIKILSLLQHKKQDTCVVTTQESGFLCCCNTRILILVLLQHKNQDDCVATPQSLSCVVTTQKSRFFRCSNTRILILVLLLCYPILTVGEGGQGGEHHGSDARAFRYELLDKCGMVSPPYLSTKGGGRRFAPPSMVGVPPQRGGVDTGAHHWETLTKRRSQQGRGKAWGGGGGAPPQKKYALVTFWKG